MKSANYVEFGLDDVLARGQLIKQLSTLKFQVSINKKLRLESYLPAIATPRP
jgi:hypothetical protein